MKYQKVLHDTNTFVSQRVEQSFKAIPSFSNIQITLEIETEPRP